MSKLMLRVHVDDFIENNIKSLVRLPFLELCFISHTTNVDI